MNARWWGHVAAGLARVMLLGVMLAPIGLGTAVAQGGADCKSDADRIVELQKRIAIWDKRVGEAQVQLADAQAEEAQAGRDLGQAKDQFFNSNPGATTAKWQDTSTYRDLRDKGDAAYRKGERAKGNI